MTEKWRSNGYLGVLSGITYLVIDTPVPLLYNLNNVFIEWVSNGRLTSFSKKNFKSLFEMAL